MAGSVLAVVVIVLSVVSVGLLMLPTGSDDDVSPRQSLFAGEPTDRNETSGEPWTPHVVKGADDGLGEPDEVHEDIEGPDEVHEDVEGPVPDDEKKG